MSNFPPSTTLKKRRVVAAAIAAAVAVAGLGAWLALRDGSKDSKPLAAPSKLCWDGSPRSDNLQKLLGPGKKLMHTKGPYRVIDDHYSSHCEYEALGDDGLEGVLDVDITWDKKEPSKSVLPVAGAGPDEHRTKFNAGVLAYYLRGTNRVYFRCDVDYSGATPEYMKRDRFISVDVLARPMRSVGMAPDEARRVGLSMLLELSRTVAKQAGCKNDTNLPAAVPDVQDVNWPGFEGK
ncbi:hypothetical protein ABT010_29660 [Streptomyces sp. NPDC002668]|uniref:hypothetical protein n=1 Tax=Streptomyces sp. NPDC002668 TaxID=3154422 RepID=UPI0033172E1D